MTDRSDNTIRSMNASSMLKSFLVFGAVLHLAGTNLRSIHVQRVLPGPASNGGAAEVARLEAGEQTDTSSVVSDGTATAAENKPLDWNCAYDQDEDLLDCESRFVPALHYPAAAAAPAAATENATKASRWFFFGDSTMARTFQQIPFLSSNWDKVKEDTDRTNRWKHNYYGTTEIQQAAEELVPPDPIQGEGPSREPANMRGMRCTFCKNELWQHKRLPVRAEYFGMEYTKDRAFQTKNSTTTQKTIRLYIQKQHKQDAHTICVFNTGFHEMIIDNPPVNGTLHARNAMSFIQDMKPICDRFVRVTINQVQKPTGKHRWPQTFERVQEWNEAMTKELTEYNSNSDSPILMLDVFPKSLHTHHKDHSHMDANTFYKPLAQFWMQLILASSH
ncbi:expressed unknown protein [Seminavis robusta]|uniref:Uncharacterized protein n=1 Tax=Seminavis robusta TaxID=568900 RepID=A0A9N8DZ95_9STRA|nr:expressed unknown protein [Seminavis robusta]|eukprot:Sro359_g126100.1 n/a (390) ;mRNA; r:34329-35498